MRTLLLGLGAVALWFAEGQLPGRSSRLARCSRCRWRKFVAQLTDSTGCRKHPDDTDYVPDGRNVRVRCFSGTCPNESVVVKYDKSRHTERDFRCEAHRREQ
jgi:hypothetical protein